MPEGPEVKIVGEDLDLLLTNTLITNVEILGGKFIRFPIQGHSKLKYPLKCEGVTTKGKLIIVNFKEVDFRLYITLGMTGMLSPDRTHHSHIAFHTDLKDPFPTVIYYNDPRRFGNLYFTSQKLEDKLAPSIFTITSDEFVSRLKQKKTTKDIVSVLMDQQSVCSGIGNYLVAEILFATKINPFRPTQLISIDEARELHAQAQIIVQASYRARGASVRDFFSFYNEKGEYSNHLKVYSRHITPRGEKIVSQQGKHKRTVWWVPDVQK